MKDQSLQIADIIRYIDDATLGSLNVPEFQRKYVWRGMHERSPLIVARTKGDFVGGESFRVVSRTDRDSRKRHREAVLTSDRLDQAAWSECAAAWVATFQGRSSPMRLMGCSAMRDRTFRR